MSSIPSKAGLLAFVCSLVLVPLVRRVANANGWVSAPRPDRWSTRPVALFGGVAVFAAYVLPILVFVPFRQGQYWSLIAAGLCMFALGLVDDMIAIKPASKLIGQIIGAAMAVYLGHNLLLSGLGLLNVPVSIFWIVAISNAYNLIDNMDGLAAGVGVVALVFMAALRSPDANPTLAIATFSLLGSLCGFLIFNANPASIFMGDAGSLFVGLTLAVLSIHIGTHGGSLAAVAVPCLVLLVPILDMTMVSATRILTGRSVAEGGRDHSSHRLVSLGLSERSAVLLLCGLSAAAGTGAILVRRLSSGSGALSFTLLVIAFGIFGVYLSRMTFDAAAAGERKARRSIATEILYEFAFKRRLLEVTLDLVLMMCAYALAYGLRFDFQLPDVFYRSLILSLPLVVAASFPCFFAVGVYRGMWQFTGPREIGRFFVGAVVATLVSLAAVVSIYRFDGFSRSVFPLYGLLLFVFVALSRLSFRLLSGLIVSLRPEPEGAVRVAIYGAGQLGEILAGELYRANGHAPMKPVGFIDDNESKRGHGIHGVPVLGGVHELEKLYSRTKFERLLVSSRKISEGNLWRAKEFCRARGIRVQRYDWVCEDVE